MRDNIYAATLEPYRDLYLLDLTELISTSNEDYRGINVAISMLFNAPSYSYEITKAMAIAINKYNLDGIIYPSHYSSIRHDVIPYEVRLGMPIDRYKTFKNNKISGDTPNIALFGRPIKENKLIVKEINRIVLEKVIYEIIIGPAGV